MIQLLIADDEYLSRHAFLVIIKKHFPEIQVIAEAENGMEALELTRKLTPDLIIMDIHMPGLNGLAAAEQILLELPSTVIVIISAYDDFDYLQKALEIGIKAYFLKPFHTGTIISKLNRIIECMKSSQEKKIQPDFDNNIAIIEKVVHKELVSSYMNGGLSTKSTDFYADFFHYDIKKGYFLLVIFKDLADSLRENAIHYTLFREKIIHSIAESLEYLCFHMIGNFMLNYLPIFIPVSESYNFKSEAMLIGKEILRKLNYHRLSASVAIGSVQTGSENFHISFQEALHVLHTIEPGQVHLATTAQIPVINFSYPYTMESQLTDELRKKDLEAARKTAYKIVSTIITSPGSLALKKEYVTQLFASMKHIVNTLHFSMDPFHEKWPFSACAYLENEEELNTFCISYLDDFMNTLAKQITTPNYTLIEKVDSYISQNLTDSVELSLDNLASYLGFSPQYVSRIFKEEYAQTFTEYISWKRIELAKKYLATSNCTVAQIAEMVGYQDNNYFCRVFKKITGMTPKEYKLTVS